MTKIYLVRHGETLWNREGRRQGHTDIALSDLGHWQAERIADRLSMEKFDAIYSSDLSRASMTAAAIAARHGLEVHSTSLLREQQMGDWEGLRDEDVVALGQADYLAAAKRDSLKYPPPGGETKQQMWDRMEGALKAILKEGRGESLVVVGHGGSLRVLICIAMATGLDSLTRLTLDNASLSRLEWNGSDGRIGSVNETGHLRISDPSD